MIEKKKIFYIWKSPYPWDVRIEKICNALVEFGYEVYIVCLWGGEEKGHECINGINIVRVGYNENPKKYIPIPFNPFWKKQIIKLINELQPDLIINREMYLADISGKLAKKFNIPIIMDMAENYPAAMKLWKKYSNTFLKRLIYHKLDLPTWLERKSLKYMKGLIVVCDENGERVKDKYNYKNKIVTIYNTPSKDFFKNTEPKNKILQIIHHGHLTNEKNFLQFFKEYVEIINNKEISVQLYIYGDGENLKDYISMVPQSTCNHSIQFKGSYKFEEIYNKIEIVDLGIIPYEVNDFNQNTLHNKIFDYMMMGKAIIVSSNKPMTNIIEKYDCGWVLQNNAELLKLLKSIDEEKLKEKGRNSRNAYISQFNWENDKLKLKEFIGGFL